MIHVIIIGMMGCLGISSIIVCIDFITKQKYSNWLIVLGFILGGIWGHYLWQIAHQYGMIK